MQCTDCARQSCTSLSYVAKFVASKVPPSVGVRYCHAHAKVALGGILLLVDTRPYQKLTKTEQIHAIVLDEVSHLALTIRGGARLIYK